MCGFSGYIDFHKSRFADTFWKLHNPLLHRGPDYHGKYTSDNRLVGLSHSRLSILDLSSQANQPFYSRDGRYVMAYNGEVYNYKSIASTLDIKRQTGSDTEVILEAFALEGPDFVQRLNGMFCMAIYDIFKNELHLFRDRVGIKPLFFYVDTQGLLFGSELKSISPILHAHSLLHTSRNAIANYLKLGYIPESQSIFEKVKKFPSGSYAHITSTDINISKYWNAEDIIAPAPTKNKIEAKASLQALLQNSVKNRLVSDVPLGTFLSGGIDSSLVTALSQRYTANKIKTFTIGFKEEKFNEADYAKNIAKHLNTEHYEKILSYRDAQERIEKLLDLYDEPFADSSAIPTLLVSEFAREKVKVVLSGDGGDELFMGYGMYNWATRLNNPFLKYFRRPIGRLLQKTPNLTWQRAGKVFDFNNWDSWNEHIFSQEQYLFSDTEVNNLLTFPYQKMPIVQKENTRRRLSPAERQALFDFNFYLKDDLLTKVDRASMHCGLEVRVPLLDHNVVQGAMNIYHTLKIQGEERKIILKEILYDYIPTSFFDRPKRGFAIPLNQWLLTDLKYLIDKYLNKSVVESYNICRYAVVKELVDEFFNGKNYLYNRVWLLIILHQWLCINDSNVRLH